LNDESKGVKEKVSEEEYNTVKTAVDEGIEWLDSNPQATKEEFDEKRVELENLIQPIIAKAYGGQQPGGPTDGGEDAGGFHDDL